MAYRPFCNIFGGGEGYSPVRGNVNIVEKRVCRIANSPPYGGM